MTGAEETAILLVVWALCLALGAVAAPRLGADSIGDSIGSHALRIGAVALVALAWIVLVVGCAV